jgi:hypothetical protein
MSLVAGIVDELLDPCPFHIFALLEWFVAVFPLVES